VNDPLRASGLFARPHRRFNPLLREWVLVSPQRTERPWLGKVEAATAVERPRYDPECYLCPGNARAGGLRNPEYSQTFVFENDYAALLPPVGVGAAAGLENETGLLVARSEAGVCRVVCFSPRHDLTVARMTATEMRAVVEVWAEQFTELAALDWVRHVQIFENRGELMGASNPHPHCQIWAEAEVPNIPEREVAALADYRAEKHSCLLCDYLAVELRLRERVVCENESFAAVVPYWAVWPFEMLLLSKRHIAGMDEFSLVEREQLADILRRVTIRYDNLFATAFPYSMGFHQRPTDGGGHPECHFHGHYFPPLLRSATIQKFMVGYELLGSPQRDILPEAAAERLRAASEIHYLDRAI
jgi:UDPglucose--hexose-1-phosphate uridylyltransferase